MNGDPDLVLIYYEHPPAHMDAFLASVLADVGITVGPATIVAHSQHPAAVTLDDLLPDAVVDAMTRLIQRSLELDESRIACNQFEARSGHEAEPVRGHVFRMYARQGARADITPRLPRSGQAHTRRAPGDKLYVGMPFDEIVRLLGEPSGVNPGTEMLEGGPHHIVAVSEETRAQLARTQYCMWKRPEGMYLLVIEDGRLARIQGKP